jgi:hypothetical protein
MEHYDALTGGPPNTIEFNKQMKSMIVIYLKSIGKIVDPIEDKTTESSMKE